jgi:adenylate cyclase
MTSPSGLLAELKRRRVFRVAVVYAAVAWIVIEVSDTVLPRLELPDWAVTLVVALALAGFPLALVLAWAFEITPTGVARTPPVERSEPWRRQWRAGRIAVVGAVAILAVAAGGWWLSRGGDVNAPPRDRSIAVLPFSNLSPDAENAFFADGMTEDIIAQLAMVRDLAVIARTSVLPYRGSDLGAAAIASRLRVGYILEGSVRRSGDRVRVVAQLVDGRTEAPLWSETFDRHLADVFAVQSEVALRIATALEAALSPEERERILDRPTRDAAAYDLFLRARELPSGSREANETAIELLRQALARDPGFALAYGSLAGRYSFRVQVHGFGAEWADSAVTAARKAIELAPDQSTNHHSLGLALDLKGRVREAGAAYERARELTPNAAASLNNLAVTRLLLGHLDEALHLARRANRLDPASAFPLHIVGILHTMLGDTEAGRAALLDARERHPDFEFNHVGLVITELEAGQAERALDLARSLAAERPDRILTAMAHGLAALEAGEYAEAVGALGRFYVQVPEARLYGRLHSLRLLYAAALHLDGHRAEAAPLLDAVLASAHEAHEAGVQLATPAAEIGIVHALRGEAREAGIWLERAYQLGDRGLFIRSSRLLGEFREEAGYHRLRERIASDREVMRRRSAGG